MTRRLLVPLACALLSIGMVTGCGGSADKSKTGATSGLSIATVKHLNKVNAAKSLAACKQAAANPGLPAAEKPLMDQQCEYIKTGNAAGLHAVARQLCQVGAEQKPEPQRSTLLAQCKHL
ncbi:MAG TPA: hypothetical protein VG388_12235 [Solirubrobacteraceae bacterium]|nr:hypothetical protein [Solirubrobacteraceae bacterium]